MTAADPVVHRRALHRIPEVDFDLPETLAYIHTALLPLNCEVSIPARSSIVAWFDAGAEETVAFRTDTDALPVPECTGLEFASTHEGKMHACGHDGHMAMAISLAETVDAMLKAGEKLPRNVMVIFQPAEETTGGALGICETGILKDKNVTRCFGMHLWPKLAEGEVFTRTGPMMASSNEITLDATGKSVHVSKAAEGRDALRAAMGWMNDCYAAAEALPADALCTLQFGKFAAGTVRNALAGTACAEGTLRTYDDLTAQTMYQAIEESAERIEKETGVLMKVTISRGAPPVSNPKELTAYVRENLPEIRELDKPVLAAEDFSVYQRYVPSVFFFLGVGDTEELHNPRFVWNDEKVLPKGVAFLRKLLLLK